MSNFQKRAASPVSHGFSQPLSLNKECGVRVVLPLRYDVRVKEHWKLFIFYWVMEVAWL
jgi:hypothetical protein